MTEDAWVNRPLSRPSFADAYIANHGNPVSNGLPRTTSAYHYRAPYSPPPTAERRQAEPQFKVNDNKGPPVTNKRHYETFYDGGSFSVSNPFHKAVYDMPLSHSNESKYSTAGSSVRSVADDRYSRYLAEKEAERNSEAQPEPSQETTPGQLAQLPVAPAVLPAEPERNLRSYSSADAPQSFPEPQPEQRERLSLAQNIPQDDERGKPQPPVYNIYPSSVIAPFATQVAEKTYTSSYSTSKSDVLSRQRPEPASYTHAAGRPVFTPASNKRDLFQSTFNPLEHQGSEVGKERFPERVPAPAAGHPVDGTSNPGGQPSTFQPSATLQSRLFGNDRRPFNIAEDLPLPTKSYQFQYSTSSQNRFPPFTVRPDQRRHLSPPRPTLAWGEEAAHDPGSSQQQQQDRRLLKSVPYRTNNYESQFSARKPCRKVNSGLAVPSGAGQRIDRPHRKAWAAYSEVCVPQAAEKDPILQQADMYRPDSLGRAGDTKGKSIRLFDSQELAKHSDGTPARAQSKRITHPVPTSEEMTQDRIFGTDPPKSRSGIRTNGERYNSDEVFQYEDSGGICPGSSSSDPFSIHTAAAERESQKQALSADLLNKLQRDYLREAFKQKNQSSIVLG
eukprot:CAMPEP_0175125578 /NCGR_PEP_ID=MMETSP0087-20121206/3389_1 /TAXON_ID=136419 /ORGANISM="Unknown Unknown, Strain D1" /LENGTH=615 /DNA_ID=CAMNT_0016407421 /DNA_START=25 /DNA_END=1872 /DNA_ORIENTATION=-